jgi:hypothetical protein
MEGVWKDDGRPYVKRVCTPCFVLQFLSWPVTIPGLEGLDEKI